MLRSVNDMSGFHLVATDGEIGHVEEFYFDDERWALRYVVVNSGNWLAGRQTLISPFSVTQVDWEKRLLHVALTKSQVKHSPDIDTHQPVSRQMEAKYADYYGYPYYWGSPFLWGAEGHPALAARRPTMAPATTTFAAAASSAVKGPAVTGVSVTGRLNTNGTAAPARVIPPDIHLRSTQEVSAYSIAATDGELGHVEDFIVEEDSWAIRYLVVDTHKWWAGKKVMIAPKWIASIDWAQANVHVTLPREGIKQSPTYNGTALLSRAYEEQLYGHYGQPGYWLN
ncbi:MAG: PRC-barrel domain containing protein [Acidobacteria bacterium]|nr:PRC-barrel domain containing protein [Acidobacteriota bacterium]